MDCVPLSHFFSMEEVRLYWYKRFLLFSQLLEYKWPSTLYVALIEHTIIWNILGIYCFFSIISHVSIFVRPILLVCTMESTLLILASLGIIDSLYYICRVPSYRRSLCPIVNCFLVSFLSLLDLSFLQCTFCNVFYNKIESAIIIRNII